MKSKKLVLQQHWTFGLNHHLRFKCERGPITQSACQHSAAQDVRTCKDSSSSSSIALLNNHIINNSFSPSLTHSLTLSRTHKQGK